MVSERASRSLLIAMCGLLLGSAVAGCVGLDVSTDGPSETTEKTSARHSPTETPTANSSTDTATSTQVTERSTLGPAIVSDGEATMRAQAAENETVTWRLDNATCLNDWGTDPTVMNRNATVLNRTSVGVYVYVQQPYWTSTNHSEDDGAVRATYLVTENETSRVSGRELSPC